MITLFRKTRLRLLEESSLRKYLLYAIGEILLVVIGILIAVQINNWNEEKRERVIEKKALENLKGDLLVQNEILDEQLVYEQERLLLCDSSLLFLSGKISAEILDALITDLTSRHTLIANQPTYDNLRSSKGISIIKNQQLQKDIMHYYQSLEYIIKVTNNNNSNMVDHIFGTFVASNLLGLTLDGQGKIGAATLTNEKRYLLKSELRERKLAAESIERICKAQYKLTEELIIEIEQTLLEFEE